MQTINKWTLAIVVLCWVAGATAQRSFASLNGLNSTFGSRTEDYIKDNKRQYENNIEYMKARLEDYRDSYEAQKDTVKQLITLINAKLQDVGRRLFIFEFHDDSIRHCVQKYKKELPTIDSLMPNITNCVTTWNTKYNSIVEKAGQLTEDIINSYKTDLNRSLDDCKKLNSQISYSICAIEVISEEDRTFAYNMGALGSMLNNFPYTQDGQLRETRDCTFDIFYKTTKKIGEVVDRIENCYQGKPVEPVEQVNIKPDVIYPDNLLNN